ncbi:MAG: Na+/H+ antiporter NhaA [Acidobacteriota bacterium]
MGAKSVRGKSGRGRVAIPLPFHEFFKTEAAGGVILLGAALAALAWANSPWAESYAGAFSWRISVGAGPFLLSKPLLLWINDGLMALFFFVVGLEIKREILVGELSTPRQALLPIAGALGGMAVPAALYMMINAGGAGAAGWGIPMATDIAFALGVLALLGDRVPPALRVFLAALAIVDDLGAVLVIAIFYTDGIRMAYLGAGLGVLAGLVLLASLGMRSLGLYALAGAAVWVFFLKSGIHPTVAGVLLAMTIPARVAVEGPRFLEKARKHLGEFASETSRGRLLTPSQHEALLGLTGAAQEASAPLQRLEHALHPWVTFGIMPLFALANAGVALDVGGTGRLWGPVTAGTAAGLLLGKPLGIVAGAYLVVRTGLSPMPDGAGWRTFAGVGCLAGIGFTMALFIAGLAFGAGELLPQAKVGILGASALSGLAGYLILRRG